MKIVIYTLILSSLLGCNKVPVSTADTTNSQIKVEKLFTYEDCTVYRFFDAGDHYFTNCKNNTETIATRFESCGKGCTIKKDENIITHYP